MTQNGQNLVLCHQIFIMYVFSLDSRNILMRNSLKINYYPVSDDSGPATTFEKVPNYILHNHDRELQLINN